MGWKIGVSCGRYIKTCGCPQGHWWWRPKTREGTRNSTFSFADVGKPVEMAGIGRIRSDERPLPNLGMAL
jgi:hypothetical protein